MNLSVFKTTLTAAAISLAIAEPAAAAIFDGGNNELGLGQTIISTAANSNKQGWSDNAALTYDAWGMQGSWLSFHVTSPTDTVVTATAQIAGTIAPAFTIYRTFTSWQPWSTGNTVSTTATDPLTGLPKTTVNWQVPGQTAANSIKDPITGVVTKYDTASGAIHKFSQVAQAGQDGIVWGTYNPDTAVNPNGWGIVETLGYANSGPSHAQNSFLQQVNAGANDVSLDNLYESAITGSVGNGFASLKLNNLASGWYTVFVSGANSALAGGAIDVSVAAVPVPGAVWLFGSALVGFMGMSRRKQIA